MRTIFLSFLFMACVLTGFSQEKTRDFTIGEIHKLHSDVLDENRVLNIYLPPGYHDQDTTQYAVIYLLDGSADEDFVHISGLVQFSTFPWINYIQPCIVVGIANIDRKRDFTFPTTIEKDKKDFPTTGKSSAFISFIEKELKPYVQKTFRTNGSATIIGQSLGGLLASEILIKKPQLFNRYLIVSPSLWWDNESLLSQPFVPTVDSKEVFIAVGKEGKQMVSDAKKLVSLCRRNKNMQVHFEYLPHLNHANILHEAVYKAFEWIGKNSK